ncbi:MAG TPA: YggS family pyridoxal phosphate-dependent enzyme [Pseudonocardiaceae bacterium]
MNRRDELAAALARLTTRIERAARSAGRDPADIRVVAVTKTFPAQDAALLTDLGVTDLGENRDQEGGRKAEELRLLRPAATPCWHMVGRLQRNKARTVVRWAAVVQSVDSRRLADALHRAVRAALDAGHRCGPLDVLLQASLDDDPGRGGCPLAELPQLADQVAASDELRLRGLMAVAPFGTEPDRAFETLHVAAVALRARHPAATELSAGMTGDLEAAIRHGSTCVRVGTALLGSRPLTSP